MTQCIATVRGAGSDEPGHTTIGIFGEARAGFGFTDLTPPEAPAPDESALRPMLDKLSREFSNVAVSSRPVSTRRKGLKVVVSLESTAATEEEADAATDEALRRLLAMATGSV